MKNIINVILVGLSVISCIGPEEIPKPENLLPEDRYMDLLIEMQQISNYVNAQPDSALSDSLKNLVFEHYDASEEQFLNSHKYYQSQVAEQLERTQKIINRLETEQKLISAYMDSVSIDSLSTDSIKIIPLDSIQQSSE